MPQSGRGVFSPRNGITFRGDAAKRQRSFNHREESSSDFICNSEISPYNYYQNQI
jgi:hypothetical protein